MERKIASAMPGRRLFSILALAWVVGCAPGAGDDAALSRSRESALRVGEHLPEGSEAATVGAIEERIRKGTPRFGALVECECPSIVFKDEEGTGSDRVMTPRLRAGLERLSRLVSRRWGLALRVTEAWDGEGEHGPESLHYEGRAADLTTSDVDRAKLGWLARLAVEAELDWVYFEDASHVHVSVRAETPSRRERKTAR